MSEPIKTLESEIKVNVVIYIQRKTARNNYRQQFRFALGTRVCVRYQTNNKRCSSSYPIWICDVALSTYGAIYSLVSNLVYV
jgi:hypothetical protein